MSLRPFFAAVCLLGTIPLGAQSSPEPQRPTPEINNRNLDQFQAATPAMVNGAVNPAAPPGATGPALTFPQDRGAHPTAPRERWVLKALLRNAAGETFPFQLTFLRRTLGGAPEETAWSRAEILTAQATLTLETEARLLQEGRRGRLGLPAGASEDRLGLRCDGWSITDPGDGRFHVDVPLSGGRVRLALAYRGEPLSLPAFEPGEDLRRTLRAALQAEGRLEVEGRVPIVVSGRALLLQEWGPEPAAAMLGWDHAFTFLKDGRTLLSFGPHTASGVGRTLLLELNPQGLPTFVARPPAPKPRRYWTSRHSRARYPIAVQIQDPRQPLAFEPAMDDQEWQGNWVGALSFWSGVGVVKTPQGGNLGNAFWELAGYAHPIQGRH